MFFVPDLVLANIGAVAFKLAWIASPVPVTVRPWCAMTNGPSWSVVHPETGRRLTVAYEPKLDSFVVYCLGSMWSFVKADRLNDAISAVMGTWANTWSADRERSNA